MRVEYFPSQCGALIITDFPETASRDTIEEKTLEDFREVLNSCVRTRVKPKTKKNPAFVQEILVVVTLNYLQIGWEEILKEHGFAEVSCWVNYNYGCREAKKWNKMFVLQSFDKETMV